MLEHEVFCHDLITQIDSPAEENISVINLNYLGLYYSSRLLCLYVSVTNLLKGGNNSSYHKVSGNSYNL